MKRLASAAGLLLLAACSRLSDAKAEQLVRDYNATVIEAYRTADVQLAVKVAGSNEVKKLTGLIGARQDADLVLDSELLSLVVLKVERAEGTVTVTTKERWSYRDRQIGTGAQVGEESTDEYEMRYVLVRSADTWLVDRIEWASPPKVGRERAPLSAAAHVSHVTTPGDDAGATP